MDNDLAMDNGLDVGAELRLARESRGLSLEQVAHTTKIPVTRLAAIEENAVDQLPPLTYVKGYLRTIAAEVGLDPDVTVDRYLQQSVLLETPSPRPQPAGRELAAAHIPPVEEFEPLEAHEWAEDEPTPNHPHRLLPGDSGRRPVGTRYAALAVMAVLGLGTYMWFNSDDSGHDEYLSAQEMPPAISDESGQAADAQRATQMSDAPLTTEPESPAIVDAPVERAWPTPEAVPPSRGPVWPTREAVAPTREVAPKRDAATSREAVAPREVAPKREVATSREVLSARDTAAREAASTRAADGNRETALPASPTSHDLTGMWQLTTEVESASQSAFNGMHLSYRIELAQDGDSVTGRGFKILENGRPLGASARTPMTLTGSVDEKGRVELRFTEQGLRRQSNGTFVMVTRDDGSLRGSFASDAAQSAGRSVLHRVR
ncbi:MAG TPA: helix-turn-helix domain-containing protein [Vicinamibacterales bacterium]|nr:helix-turn-helix domain-containing protein [Vicinamibacterales bacterium]